MRAICASRAAEIQWASASSSYPDMDRKGRKAIDKAIAELADSGEQLHPDNKSEDRYTGMPDDQRILSIGSSLENDGMDFLDRRPHHARWLRGKSISPEQARLRYTEWRDAFDKKRAAAKSEPISEGE